MKGLGLGVYDIHSPRVPATEEIYQIIDDALEVCPTDRFWVNPDCGLKTRQQEETVAALKIWSTPRNRHEKTSSAYNENSHP